MKQFIDKSRSCCNYQAILICIIPIKTVNHVGLSGKLQKSTNVRVLFVVKLKHTKNIHLDGEFVYTMF